jgi:hypothetical protein
VVNKDKHNKSSDLRAVVVSSKGALFPHRLLTALRDPTVVLLLPAKNAVSGNTVFSVFCTDSNKLYKTVPDIIDFICQLQTLKQDLSIINFTCL